MEKVINITIGRQVFNVEEDAYIKLSDYLTAIEKHFTKDKNKAEILEDIESSISDKFAAMQTKNKSSVIGLDDVEAVMKQMGDLEDFENLEMPEEGEFQKEKKKLYRDGEDMIVAGVASGIAAFLGVSEVWVRLIFFVSVFFGGIGVILYVILWIILPVAETTTQKMEMKGERITLKEIEKSVRESLNKFSGKNSILNSFFEVMGKIAVTILEFLRVIFGVALMILGVVGVGALSFGLGWMLTGSALPYTDVNLSEFVVLGDIMYSVFVFSLYVLILVPFTFLFLMGLSLMKKRNVIKPFALIVLFVLWFASMGVVGSVAFQNVDTIEEKAREVSEDWSDTDDDQAFCIEVYAPVCGTVHGERKTFSNECFAGLEEATDISEGEC